MEENMNPFNCEDLEVHAIPAVQDNYMYLIVDKTKGKAAVVDPVDPAKVQNLVEREGLSLDRVLITHYHWDHAGGNEKLIKMFNNLVIYGGDDRIYGLQIKVSEGDMLRIGSMSVKCLQTPFHTNGDICYYVTSKESDVKAVFTGDALFVGGCGRLVEGQPQQMFNSLQHLASLPNDTFVYGGHENTVANLQFALKMEPENQIIADKLSWATNQNVNHVPTVPSTIGDEKSFNPFLRAHEGIIQTKTNTNDALAALVCLRNWRDEFKSY